MSDDEKRYVTWEEGGPAELSDAAIDHFKKAKWVLGRLEVVHVEDSPVEGNDWAARLWFGQKTIVGAGESPQGAVDALLVTVKTALERGGDG